MHLRLYHERPKPVGWCHKPPSQGGSHNRRTGEVAPLRSGGWRPFIQVNGSQWKEPLLHNSGAQMTVINWCLLWERGRLFSLNVFFGVALRPIKVRTQSLLSEEEWAGMLIGWVNRAKQLWRWFWWWISILIRLNAQKSWFSLIWSL